MNFYIKTSKSAEHCFNTLNWQFLYKMCYQFIYYSYSYASQGQIFQLSLESCIYNKDFSQSLLMLYLGLKVFQWVAPGIKLLVWASLDTNAGKGSSLKWGWLTAGKRSCSLRIDPKLTLTRPIWLVKNTLFIS